MSEHGEGAERYGFEQFMLDPERSELHGPDGVIQLRPKSYDLLLYLVRHPGRLIGREELLDAVWGQRAVTDDSVTQCLVEIRRALADHGRRIVRTVPRRGYLFDVPVARIPGPNGPEEQANVPAADAPASATAPPAALHGAMPYPRLAAATVTFLALALAWWAFATRDATRPDRSMFDAPAVPNSIAVLPFADMSAEGDQEYFGDGIAEEILNLLAQAPELKVIARTSSFSFKHQPADITTIAARLGVAHVLEGSVRKWGNRVRVTAQLVSGRDGAHLWSQTYDRELGDLFEVQGDIAGAVAGVLEARLLTRPAVAVTPETRDVRAYDLFLRARFQFNRRDHGDLDRAREQLETALAIDPEYAPAWALLSGVYNVLLVHEGLSREIGIPRRREAAERALALDANLPDAHLRAIAVYAEDGDFDRVRHHLQIAQALDPDHPLLLGLSTGHALAHGRIDEANELWQRIIAIDPLSSVSRFNYASTLMAAGRLEEARAELLAMRELAPGRRGEIDAWLAKLLVLERRPEEALRLLEAAEEGRIRDIVLALAHRALGQDLESAAAMARLRADASGNGALALAEVHAFGGDADEAFAWLAEAKDRFQGELSWGDHRWAQLANVSAFLRVLHDDPRWDALHAEVRSRF
jgi:TolB-like protein/DNA-binding winged helix-turn-helix (wHTH) protein/thioredoxin-like negative regulator of GroEL